jgi:hypothetical protein
MAGRRRKTPKKPTRRRLTAALAKAELFYASNAGADTPIGRHADEVVGPILHDYRRLRGLLRQTAEAIEGSTVSAKLLGEIGRALLDSTPIVE